MESLMASAILAGAVVTVIYAITAGQQHAYQAKEQIAASLVAEELLGDIIKKSYDDIVSSSGFRFVNGVPVFVLTTEIPDLYLPGVNVVLAGAEVKVQVKASNGATTVMEYTHFVPAPPS